MKHQNQAAYSHEVCHPGKVDQGNCDYMMYNHLIEILQTEKDYWTCIF